MSTPHMENKELYTKKFDSQDVKEIIVQEESLSIILENDTFTLVQKHEQDGYEYVYADFEIMEYHKKTDLQQCKGLTIYGVPEMGIILDFETCYPNKFLIPCYNEQNGYYSAELKLIIEHNNEEEVVIDIADCEQDNFH